MKCCSSKTGLSPKITDEAKINTTAKCLKCANASRLVGKKTVLLMLKSELLERAGDGHYYFCANPACRIVYFSETPGTQFYKEDLRVRVGVKETQDPKPLCYCFGFDESDLREEIVAAGKTEIPERIVELLKTKMCACEFRNPSGACCLGEIAKAIKGFKAGRRET